MEDLIRGAIAGIAVGGFTAAVVDANKIATQRFGGSTALPQKQPGSCSRRL